MLYRTFEIDGRTFMVIGDSEAELDAKEAHTRAVVAVNPPPADL